MPAIAAARGKGVEVAGPLPPDTAFLPNRLAVTDAFICMYHDQGLIPLKMLAFDSSVNVTLGLPIIRTSPDHGTAFDIAGKNKADPSSMVAAINQVGQAMQLETVAEYVENDEIKQKLIGIGVDYGQGFGFGRPVPINEIQAKLAKTA